LRGEISGLRSETSEGFGELLAEIDDFRTEFHTVMFRIWGGVIIALIGVIAVILAGGG
jgi:hypothetical protein